MKFFITGANGYIGKVICHLAQAAGHSVIEGSRHPPACDKLWVHYDLAASMPTIPAGTDAVIHLAADMRGDLSRDSEVRAARLLLVATRDIGAKFIFISSQTARPDAPTAYGRTKWCIERKVLAEGGWAIRPGLVYGELEEGTFGMMVGLVRKLPLLPAFLPAPRVQPVHVEDLAQGILHLAAAQSIHPGILSLAEDTPMTFTSFLKTIARQRVRKARLFVPTPVFLIRATGRLLPVNSTLGKNFIRLTSLFDLPGMSTARDLKMLELHLRPISMGLGHGKATARRLLLEEGRILLQYIGISFSSSLLRRYVRAMEQLKSGESMAFPVIIRLFPCALALLEKRMLTPGSRNDELAFRLHAAVTLVEATPQGSRFLRESGSLIAFFDILRAVIAECAARFFQIILYPFFCVWSKRKRISRNV